MALYYTTSADLLDLLTTEEQAEITTESGAVPDATIINNALQDAEGIVNSKLGVVYAVPALTSAGGVPAEIRRAVRIVARMLLFSRRVPPMHVEAEYEAILVWLDEVSGGRAVINLMVDGVSENNEGTAASNGVATQSGLTFSKLVP